MYIGKKLIFFKKVKREMVKVALLALCALLFGIVESRLSMNEVSGYTEETWKNMFDDFTVRFNKNYESNEEYNKRLQIYKVKQTITLLL